MAFRFVEARYEGEKHSHDGGDWYEISPAGVLVVHYADESRGVEIYPPNAWLRLIADQPPGPPSEAPIEVWKPFWH